MISVFLPDVIIFYRKYHWSHGNLETHDFLTRDYVRYIDFGKIMRSLYERMKLNSKWLT